VLLSLGKAQRQNGPREWRLEQKGIRANEAINRGQEACRVDSQRRKTTEQDCYGQGIHFEGAWAQKWAHFEKIADFWLLSPALGY
jgi:hypothetical protein